MALRNQPEQTNMVENLPAKAEPDPRAAMIAGNDVSDELYKADFSGTESIGADKLSLPSLIITDKQNKLTKHLQEGLILNTVTDELYDSLYLIPLKAVEGFHICEVQDDNNEKVIERVDDESQLPPDTHHVPGKSFKQTPKGLRVYPVIEVYALDEDMSIVRILFKKTKLKVAKKWVTQMKLTEKFGPACSFVYEITTLGENYNGHDYYNYSVKKIGKTSPDRFNEAKEWYKNVLDEFIRQGKNEHHD